MKCCSPFLVKMWEDVTHITIVAGKNNGFAVVVVGKNNVFPVWLQRRRLNHQNEKTPWRPLHPFPVILQRPKSKIAPFSISMVKTLVFCKKGFLFLSVCCCWYSNLQLSLCLPNAVPSTRQSGDIIFASQGKISERETSLGHLHVVYHLASATLIVPCAHLEAEVSFFSS